MLILIGFIEMKKKIIINNKQINYTLKRSRTTKRLRLSVSCSGLQVSAPYLTPEFFINNFIKQKIDWILEKILFFETKKQETKEIFADKSYYKYKERARAFVNQKLKAYKNDFDFNRVSIKQQKTRWGSCSSGNNLNFNYKILFLPEKLADYIIVHELCHLKELNHSSKFWNLVGKYIPDYKERRRELKKYSL